MSAICLGARVRIRKTGILGTVQHEEVMRFGPNPGSACAIGMQPLMFIEIAGDDGAIHWPLTAADVEVCEDAANRWRAAAGPGRIT